MYRDRRFSLDAQLARGKSNSQGGVIREDNCRVMLSLMPKILLDQGARRLCHYSPLSCGRCKENDRSRWTILEQGVLSGRRDGVAAVLTQLQIFVEQKAKVALLPSIRYRRS